MPRSINVRRSLALTGAFVLATWGTAALPASALDPGSSNGNATGQAQHQKKDHDQKSEDKKSDDKSKSDGKSDDKSGGGKGGGTSDQSGDQTQGNKGGNGKGNGPKSPNPGNGGNGGNGGSGDQGGKGGKGDPAGNNGTVKITPIGEDDGTPQNTPHVVCGFDIEWYGFDEGEDIVSTVEFAAQAPTGDAVISGTDPAQVFVGGDPATGAGTETGFDGEQTYHLGFTGEPHPQQGYHVKLTIHTPGSQGADTKHKVFWVQPCADEVSGTTDETDETGGTTDTDDTTEEGDDSTLVLGEQASADTASSDQAEDTQVMGAQASAPASVLAAEAANGEDVPSAVDAGESGNPVVDFVTSPLPLLVIALGALLAGAALVTRRRSNA
jgi:hypothetical protein